VHMVCEGKWCIWCVVCEGSLVHMVCEGQWYIRCMAGADPEFSEGGGGGLSRIHYSSMA
jgi:hypothetical protein